MKNGKCMASRELREGQGWTRPHLYLSVLDKGNEMLKEERGRRFDVPATCSWEQAPTSVFVPPLPCFLSGVTEPGIAGHALESEVSRAIY